MYKKWKVLSVIVILAVSFITGISLNTIVYSKDNEYKGEEFINVTVYEKINPAIVLVEAQLADGLSSGTGCIINKIPVKDNKYYYGLFWDEEKHHEVDFKEGFYVTKENAFIISKKTFSFGTAEDFSTFIKNKCKMKFKNIK